MKSKINSRLPCCIWCRLRESDLCWESDVGRALPQITGLNDKRKFYKIVPLSYCGLVMPKFFSVCYFEVSGLVFMWSKEKAMRSISDCKNDRTQCCHKNHEAELSPVRYWSISLSYKACTLSVFSKGTKTPNGQALTKHQTAMMTSKI